MKPALKLNKWGMAFIHVICWGVLFSLPTLLRPTNDNHPRPAEPAGFFYQSLFNSVSWIALFYLNAYVLIPKYIARGKYRLFILWLLPVFAVLFFINYSSFVLLIPERDFRFNGFVFFFLFPCMFFLAVSTAWSMIRQKLTSDRLAKEKENENLKTELAFLRSQVSPHFMFNVLNNMVALARKKSDLLEPSLIKLSSLLRYMFYETDEEKVLLTKEVEYLQSYIDLQVQRFGSKVTVKVCMRDIDTSYLIEPMLLIPFVENAFKHGTGSYEQNNIDINLQAKDKMLQFVVSNAYQHIVQEKDKTSGIGLQNVQRRLNLLYHNMHTLSICDKDDMYVVTMQLNLH